MDLREFRLEKMLTSLPAECILISPVERLLGYRDIPFDLLHTCLRMNSDFATETLLPGLEGRAKLAQGVCTAVLRPLHT